MMTSSITPDGKQRDKKQNDQITYGGAIFAQSTTVSACFRKRVPTTHARITFKHYSRVRLHSFSHLKGYQYDNAC